MTTPKIISLQLQAEALLRAVHDLDDSGHFIAVNCLYHVQEDIIPSGPRHHRQIRERLLNDWAKLYDRIKKHEMSEAARAIKIERPAKPRLTTCKQYREQDEMTCPSCGLRWGVDEDKPRTAKCL